MHTLTAMMRVKNEERWIDMALLPLLQICSRVYVLDDHSTDSTRDIVRGFDRCTLVPSPFTGLDEARDKTYLLEYLMNGTHVTPGGNSEDWVICVDGDEVLCEKDLDTITQKTKFWAVSYSFQILTLYDAEDQIRVDGPYSYMTRPSMFRLISNHLTFKRTKHGGHFHCSNVPAEIGFRKLVHNPPVRLLHYGYMRKEDRERKYEFYKKHDAGHEDWYRKECFGVPVLKPLSVVLE